MLMITISLIFSAYSRTNNHTYKINPEKEPFCGSFPSPEKMKNIVFDMGNVLLKYEPDKMLSRYTDNGEDIALCIKTVFESEEWRMCDRGDGYRDEILPPVIKKLPEHLQKYCEELLYRDDLELNFMDETEGIRQLLSDLKKAGYSLYILSNVGLCYPKLYREHPVFSNFDGFFPSAQYHLLKPDREIYEKFFEIFSLEPKDCIFIDDSIANCESSEKCGMKTICFNAINDSTEKLRSLLAVEGINI